MYQPCLLSRSTALILILVTLAVAGVSVTEDSLRAAGKGKPSADRPGEQTAAVKRLGLKQKGLLFEEIIFAVRQDGKDGHWYANFSYWSEEPRNKLYSERGKLCALNIKTQKVRTLLDAPKGSVRDPQMHYDGRKILMSYRKDGQPYYHLYEIGIDGTGLRQITNGPFDDIEPAYLPDGGIVFCSSRCNRMVQCWFTRVAVIYRCDPDPSADELRAGGKNIRALSANMEQDNTPWVLPDGTPTYSLSIRPGPSKPCRISPLLTLSQPAKYGPELTPEFVVPKMVP
jgi:hypothetical protein